MLQNAAPSAAANANGNDTSAAVEPGLTPPAIVAATSMAVLESPIFSHLKHDSSASHAASQSIQAITGTESALAPHEALTQHQCAHFLSPAALPVSATAGGVVPLTATSVNSTSSAESAVDVSANRSQHSSQPSVGAGSEGGRGLKGRLLTQSSIPAHLVWGSPAAVNEEVATTQRELTPAEAPVIEAPVEGYKLVGAIAESLSVEELAEVQNLLQGLTEADIDLGTDSDSSRLGPAVNIEERRATVHAAAASQAGAPTLARNGRTTNGVEKVSICELEIDVQAEHILNKNQPKSEFGAELWEEERLRCEAKGVGMDTAPTPPSTQTRHRAPLQTEVEYQRRFASLQAKGRALQQAGARLQRSQKSQSVSRAVLSQFAVSPTKASNLPDSSSGAPKGAPSANEVASQWAEQRIYEAQQQVQLEESLQEMFSAGGVDIAQEYAKSQVQSQYGLDDDLAELDEVKEVGGDAEQEQLQEESQECDAIVQSTQVNLENMYDLLSRSDNRSSTAWTPMNVTDGAKVDNDDIFADLQTGGSGRRGDSAAAERSRRPPALSLQRSSSLSIEKGRPPLHPSGLFATPREGPLSRTPSITSLPAQQADSPDLASRWFGHSDSPVDMIYDTDSSSPSGVVGSQFSPRDELSQVKRTASTEEPAQLYRAADDSPLLSVPGGTTSPIVTEASPAAAKSPEIAPIIRPATGSGGSGAKSISSVFRKRKRPPGSTSGATVSFALFPETIPSPVVGGPHGVDAAKDLSSPAAPSAAMTEAGTLAPEPAKKKAKRSVSFREAEEVIPPVPQQIAPTTPVPAAPDAKVPPASTTVGAAAASTTIEGSANERSGAVATLPEKDHTHGTEAAGSAQSSAVAPERRRSIEGLAYVALRPAFDPPKQSELCNLSVYGLTDVVNIPAHYSNPADAAIGGSAGSVNTTTPVKGSYLTDLHRIKAKSDIPLFDGGFPDEEVCDRYAQVKRVLSTLPRRQRCLVPTFLPPNPATLWKDATAASKLDAAGKKQLLDKSQISTPTQTPYTALPAEAAAKANVQTIGAGTAAGKRMSRLTVMSIEVFCSTRQDLLPNPKHDAVQSVFWALDDQIGNAEFESVRRLSGVICQLQRPLAGEVYHAAAKGSTSSSSELGPAADANNAVNANDGDLRRQQKQVLAACGLPADTYLEIVANEVELFQLLVQRVTRIDPDFLAGYETEQKSLGYICKRGRVLKLNMLRLLSRMPRERPSYRNGNLPSFSAEGNSQQSQADDGPAAAADAREDKTELASDMVITGRIILNVWRLMREELKLFNYTYNNVVANLLDVRVPYFTPAQLTKWFQSPHTRKSTVQYLHLLTVLNLQLLDKVDHIRRTAECARLYGIDYTSVLTRGSQYRVEASLIHLARRHNYLLLSPSRKAVASQAPMEVIPLVMEPRSQFYADPVVILDFQSLYPSMMLAYNLCFSTIMGKVRPGAVKSSAEMGASAGLSSSQSAADSDTTERLGAISYAETTAARNATLHTDQDTAAAQAELPSAENRHAYIAPNGSVFCSKAVRLGILPQMVQEMLNTRVMVKRAMKRHKSGTAVGGTGRDVLQRVMDARQLAIKLLSNVTCKPHLMCCFARVVVSL
jgi:DNA polymerase elongation subunit (family B)